MSRSSSLPTLSRLLSTFLIANYKQFKAGCFADIRKETAGFSCDKPSQNEEAFTATRTIDGEVRLWIVSISVVRNNRPFENRTMR
jgi:hypothetical protein